LVWADGGLEREQMPTSLHRIAKDAECAEAFLRLLDEQQGYGLNVSATDKAPTYAPAKFAKLPNNGGFTKNAFADAMNRLLQAGKIIQITEGTKSRQRGKLVRKP
jgi:hypothetical protein